MVGISAQVIQVVGRLLLIKKEKVNDLDLEEKQKTVPPQLLNSRSGTTQNVKFLLQQREPVALQTHFSVEHP